MTTLKLKKFQKISKGKYFSGTGRRKSATARVRIIKGTGETGINERDFSEFFNSKHLVEIALSPAKLVGFEKKIDISVIISGGGIVGQAQAVKLGLARALVKMDDGLHTTLKKSGFLTQDAREKERKKPGLKRARRAPQWQKR